MNSSKDKPARSLTRTAREAALMMVGMMLPELERAHQLRAAQEVEARDFQSLELNDEAGLCLHLAQLAK